MKNGIAIVATCVLLWGNIGFSCDPGQAFDSNGFDAYYANAYEKAGMKLKEALTDIVSDGHRYLGSRCAQTALSDVEEMIGKDAGQVRGFMSEMVMDLTFKSDSRGQETAAMMHVWPLGVGYTQKFQWPFTDLHNLRVDTQKIAWVLKKRSYVAKEEWSREMPECAGCFEVAGNFHPPDHVKGDIARTLFYIDVRYEGYAENTKTVDLRLIKEDGFDFSMLQEARLGNLCMLLDWNESDPVTTEEVVRNNEVYRWQGNRNPFVDYPGLARLIWGDKCE